MSDSCGNAAHPDGPWHPAEPLPLYPVTLIERLRARLVPGAFAEAKAYDARVKLYGCGCPSEAVAR